jgi:hypothetical protein
MGRPSKLSATDLDDIRQARTDGVPVADLAEKYGVTREAIYARFRIEPRPAPRGPQPAPAPTPAARRTATRPVRRAAPAPEQRAYPELRKGYIPRPCDEPRCGHPTNPEHGVQLSLLVYGPEQIAVEFCSWHCLSRHALHHELAGGDA